LTVAGKTLTQNFEVKKDPRIDTTPADFAKQFELLTKIRNKLNEMHSAILDIRNARAQMDDMVKHIKDQPEDKAVADAAKALNAKLSAVEEALYQVKNRSSQDPLNYPIRVNNKLAALAGVVGEADAGPTDQCYTIYDELAAEADAQLAKLRQVMGEDLAAFNKLVREKNIPAVMVTTKAAGH